MDIGVALPTMARDYRRSTTLEWSRGIDDGPFSSISCGERITFRNQEMLVTNAAAAALTERVRVFVNLVVLPFHPPAVIAKELATKDVLWHVGAMRKYGDVVEAGMDGDYCTYSLVAKAGGTQA